MIEVAYSREAMRALLMLDAGERERAIETIDKLSKAYDALRTEAENAAVKKALEESDAAEKAAKAMAKEEAAKADEIAKSAEAAENSTSEPDADAEKGDSDSDSDSENQAPDEPKTISADGDAAEAGDAEAGDAEARADDSVDDEDPDNAPSTPATKAQLQSDTHLTETDAKSAIAELAPIDVPGTLPLGARGDFCLAPFSKTGDFVVALTDKITVISLIDILDDLQEASSK